MYIQYIYYTTELGFECIENINKIKQLSELKITFKNRITISQQKF